jgi:hypothetical protein
MLLAKVDAVDMQKKLSDYLMKWNTLALNMVAGTLLQIQYATMQ